jgi:hypothetical protein
MIRLLFVGDGERDAATNPHLVTLITGAQVDPTTKPWARLHDAGRGYDRKLLFAIAQARQGGLDGVVATVDRDTSPPKDRLRDLQAGRTRDREKHPSLPTALGVADPHAEAWLLDDPVAVRTALRLPADVLIPTVRQVQSPKSEIARLHRASPRRDEPTRALSIEIAQALSPDRCQHDRETGFGDFVTDVRHEIGPLVPHAENRA